MAYNHIKSMSLNDQIERLRFQKAQLISQKLRVNDSITLTNMRIGILFEELEIAEKAAEEKALRHGHVDVALRHTEGGR